MEGVAQWRHVSHQQGAGTVGEEETLVGVDGERVRQAHAAESVRKLRHQSEGRSVGAIDVVPETFLGRHPGDLC